MRKIILSLAALSLVSTAPAFGMTEPPTIIKAADIEALPKLIQDPIDAINAHKAAGTYTTALNKKVAGNFKLVGTYGQRATAALAVNDPVAFYGNYENLKVYKVKVCTSLGNCAP